MKARIVKTKIGVRYYYYPQIQETLLYVFKFWSSLGDVNLHYGGVYYYKKLGTFVEAKEIIKNYEALYGIKLEPVGDYNWSD